ncbi:uncharacterized protein LOC126996593 [Eriocheir sinensis]|uniref:uncharacterized protein LOC126996593 n=1 Tax=Eriocheir sinensis TaxID=95602 RepID=UPI0021C609E7|nr:uncharacterized protein LOC126996593 [Eriocheir sinensis]
MKDTEPLTPDCRKRAGHKGSPPFWPLLCLTLLVLALAQAGAFFFLFGRLEDTRGRLEAATVQGGRREVRVTRDLHDLRERLDELAEECSHTKATAHARRPPASPPHPPPHKSYQNPLRNLAGKGRVKRRASDPSYGVNGALGEVSGGDGELSVQLQGEERSSDQDKSWLQLTSYAKLPVSTPQRLATGG